MTVENITDLAGEIGNDTFTSDQIFEKSGGVAVEFATIYGNDYN